MHTRPEGNPEEHVGDSMLADELAVRALIERYADAVNRRDATDWAALWTEDHPVSTPR